MVDEILENDGVEEEGDIEELTSLLPAWFVPRMMTDVWHFGLMTTTGKIIAIDTISAICQAADGSIWIDVELQADFSPPSNLKHYDFFASPTSRTTASINTANIVCAFELADT